jgi:hypothetical protein
VGAEAIPELCHESIEERDAHSTSIVTTAIVFSAVSGLLLVTFCKRFHSVRYPFGRRSVTSFSPIAAVHGAVHMNLDLDAVTDVPEQLRHT